MSQKLNIPFDNNVEEWILFDGAIQTKSTRIAYHSSLQRFMDFAGFTQYSQIKKLSTEELQKMLMRYTVELSSGDYAKGTIQNRLQGVELFLNQNMINYFQKPLRKLIKKDKHKPSGRKMYSTDDIKKLHFKDVH